VKGWTAVSETKAIDLLKDLAGLANQRSDLYRHIARWHVERPQYSCVCKKSSNSQPFPSLRRAALRAWRICKPFMRSAPASKGPSSGKRCTTGSWITPQRSRPWADNADQAHHPCLDVKDGRVVKGVSFVNLRDAGDPVEVAAVYDREGADELCFLDITASHENRKTIIDVGRTNRRARVSCP